MLLVQVLVDSRGGGSQAVVVLYGIFSTILVCCVGVSSGASGSNGHSMSGEGQIRCRFSSFV